MITHLFDITVKRDTIDVHVKYGHKNADLQATAPAKGSLINGAHRNDFAIRRRNDDFRLIGNHPKNPQKQKVTTRPSKAGYVIPNRAKIKVTKAAPKIGTYPALATGKAVRPGGSGQE